MVHKASYDALLNEYKGNLFEFLVALEFARHFDVEKEFLQKTYTETSHILEQQESFLRNYYPDLLDILPRLANKLKEKIIAEFTFSHIVKINLVGKFLGAAGDNRFNEADILLTSDKQVSVGLSIKLAKKGSYVNTKSAGIKSFFKRYFAQFGGEEIQHEFNSLVDAEFEKMAMKMHEEAGLFFDHGFQEWEKAGLECLPGKLNREYKLILIQYYGLINDKMYQVINEFYQKNPSKFTDSIWSILGLSSDNLIQAIYFHSLLGNRLQDGGDPTDSILVNKRGNKLDFVRFEKKKNTFEMVYRNFNLQFRLKPMNKFTVKSYKVNLSVKYNL